MSSEWNLAQIRSQFPALSRSQNHQPVAYFDGPAGSQVPQRVADAVANYLLTCNCNRGAVFASGQESDALLESAHHVVADFLGAEHAESIIFGANMTTLNLALSRALSRTWKPGDEVIVTQLDHDANVTPWVLAALDVGAVVRRVRVNIEDGTLDLAHFQQLLCERTKLVAVGMASNLTGTINPVQRMIAMAHHVGALTCIDAVHYAPHGRIDASAMNADFLLCSAYKFFGPHVGILYGRRSLLESLSPYKLRPSTNQLPGKWMTGTQNHEGIVGVAAAVDYLADLGRSINGTTLDRRSALDAAFAAIHQHESGLSQRFLEGLQQLSAFRVWGIRDSSRLEERVATFSLTHPRFSPREMASRLAERGLFAWFGNHYALPFTEAANLEPHGTLRLGFLHYNTAEEVDRALAALAEIDR